MRAGRGVLSTCPRCVDRKGPRIPIEQVNGTPLAYEDAGEGDAIVIVHGSWTRRQAWRGVVERLSATFRVVSYDRRGHGESAGQPDAGTVHDDVGDLVGLIELLDLAPTHLLASSYGACVALRLAGQRPDLVRKLVAHEPPAYRLLEADPGTRSVAEHEQRKLSEVRQRLERGDHAGGAEYFVEHVALGPGGWTGLPPPVQEAFVRNAPTFLGELQDPDALDLDVSALQRFSAPVLLTQGDHSPAVFAPILDVLEGVLPSARRLTLAGAGHVPHLSHADEYSAIVSEFFLQT
ncbi:MAG TPA: alpha/beta hydrolase [Acidimicrobiales bacterium]|nr:alpha/beta hydrolase [Acidimicrobiales bacterium]